MLKKVVIKLTLFYSCLFLLLFSLFSYGLYAYLKNYFKEGYVRQVNERARNEIKQEQSGESGVFIPHLPEYPAACCGDECYEEILSAGSNTPQESAGFISAAQSRAVFNKTMELTLENFRRGHTLVNAIIFLCIPVFAWFLVVKTLSPVYNIIEKQKRFISDASHELRTPLTAAANEIEITLQQERPPAYYVRTLIALKEDIAQLADLATNLLLLASHEGNAEPVKMQKVEIVDVLTNVIADYAKLCAEKNVRYQINYPEDNCLVKGNAPMLKRVFTNLIDNALKFSPKDSNITVSIQRKRQKVEIIIQDEGIGIAPEYQGKIFDRFYQVDVSRTQTKGYGLGLSIVKTIVDLHKGSVELNSIPGKGSIFTVSLPVSALSN